jgi:hypothetical protein
VMHPILTRRRIYCAERDWLPDAVLELEAPVTNKGRRNRNPSPATTAPL